MASLLNSLFFILVFIKSYKSFSIQYFLYGREESTYTTHILHAFDLCVILKFIIMHVIRGRGNYMRMKYVSVVFLGILCCLAACSTSQQKRTGKNGKLTIIYSGNIGARYDPCGCRIPLGGLARRSTAIKEIISKDPNVLRLDSGALIYEKHQLYPPYEVTMRMTAHLVAEVIDRLGIDAVNVSSMDLANSADSLVAIDKQYSSWPWLSANIVWKDSGELAFTPDIIKTVGNLRVGIFGIIDQESRGILLIDDRANVKALDPFEAARKEVEKLQKDCDLVIALAYMEKDRVEELVTDVSGINMIIQSHTREHNPSSDHIHFLPYKVGETIVARCPDGGRVLGVMELEIWNGSLSFNNEVINVDLRPESVKAAEKPEDKQSRFTNTFINLDPEIKRDRPIQDYLNEVGGKIDELKEQLKRESERN